MEALKNFIRRLDWTFNGTLTEENGKRLLPRQWAFPFITLLFFLVLGPTPRIPGFGTTTTAFTTVLYTLVLALIIVGLSLIVHAVIKSSLRLFWFQFGIVGACTFFFLYAIGWGGHLDEMNPEWRAGEDAVFPHVWQPLAMIVFLVLAIARGIAWLTFWKLPDRIRAEPGYANLSQYVDELANYEKSLPKTSWFRSFFDVLSSPVEILFPAALFLVVVDARMVTPFTGYAARWWLYRGIAVSIALAAYTALVLAQHYPFLASLRGNVRRIFWYGGSWATTVFVIALAGAWLADISYVKTVMEGSRSIVVFLVLASYAVFWTHEYWVNHIYAEELLKILGDLKDKLYVEFGKHRICIHGAAKFSIVTKPEPDAAGKTSEAWQRGPILDRSELFEHLFDRMGCPALSHELTGAGKMYFVILNTLVAIPVAIFAWGVLHEHPTRIAVERADISGKPKDINVRDMETLLFGPVGDKVTPTQAKRPRVLLVAASGGGTRAALYAASALDGLRIEGALNDVKAVSGVSGGGVALAYFAAHHATLTAGPDKDKTDLAWERFHDVMAHPYITDVLRGASEFRVPWHTSISALLPESFDRQFKTNEPGACATLGECKIGVIFNTTLVGESPPPFQLENLKPTDDSRRSDYASGLHAGSRLVLTNLADADAFPAPERQKYPRNEILRFVVVNDPTVRLTRAAALNANFPPVFPNAPIDVKETDGQHRYWVTDGGAEENRGQVSLLYAVRRAIARRSERGTPFVMPDIHLVVVEASGGSVDYKQDYGISGFSGASQKLANQLALELERDIRRLYADLHAKQLQNPAIKQIDPATPPAFKTHFLPMPSVSRIDGGVGTHWMLPETVQLGPPTVRGVPCDRDIQVNKATVKYMIRHLHNRDVTKPPSVVKRQNDIDRIQNWIDNDPLPPPHPVAWKMLCEELKR